MPKEIKEKIVKMKIITRRFKNFKAGDEQSYVEVYPKNRKHERSDIDIFRIVLNSLNERTGEKELKEVDMTPNEALLLAGNIITATMFWLINYEPYWNTFMKRVRELENGIQNPKKVARENE